MQSEFHSTLHIAPARETAEFEQQTEIAEAADYAVDDCFFAVGQAVGMRKTVDYDAVVWWRQHFRRKFMNAMNAFGPRWVEDRARVTAVAFMLAERAVRYAGDHHSISLGNAQHAAADVQRYCEQHAHRAMRATGTTEGDIPRLAGYWCIY